jgi:hypothetical protein
LPLALGTRLETIPAEIPYLTAGPTKVAEWRARVGDGFKVGLVWQGNAAHRNDRDRSLPLADLLAAMPPGVALHSLQKDCAHADCAVLAKSGVIDASSRLADFSDTAALAGLMDLVITVDTSVAHLAGALGVKTWLLLAYANDWRWLTGRDDTPWYPTMRLFRQPTFNDWDTVIARVKAALADERR